MLGVHGRRPQHAGLEASEIRRANHTQVDDGQKHELEVGLSQELDQRGPSRLHRQATEPRDAVLASARPRPHSTQGQGERISIVRNEPNAQCSRRLSALFIKQRLPDY